MIVCVAVVGHNVRISTLLERFACFVWEDGCWATVARIGLGYGCTSGCVRLVGWET